MGTLVPLTIRRIGKQDRDKCLGFPKKCPNRLLGHWPIRTAIRCLRIGLPGFLDKAKAQISRKEFDDRVSVQYGIRPHWLARSRAGQLW